MNKRKRVLILTTVFLIILGIYIYNFPYQKYVASQIFYQYIEIQGTNEENIAEKIIKKDYAQNGYTFIIKFKDDPGVRYEYRYAPPIPNCTIGYKSIFLFAFDNNGTEVTGETKYKPINQ